MMVTADTAPVLLTKCLREGGDDFLTKPIAMGAFYETLGRVMGRASSPVC